MANKIILKRSSVAGKVPGSADLDYGELALNYADGKLYYKSPGNTIDAISGNVTSITGGSYLTGGTITTSGILAVDATSSNTASKVVARDASGNFSAGTVTASNFNSTSDIRYKENIEKITNALEKVKQVNGYTFILKDTGQRSTGIIAQEIETILPEVVGGDENKKTVSYGNIVGLLIEAIKEQQLQIEDLKNLLLTK